MTYSTYYPFRPKQAPGLGPGYNRATPKPPPTSITAPVA